MDDILVLQLVIQTICWFDMPLEIREMIMNEMNTKILLKLGATCRKCQEEIQKSKNYFDSIVFMDYDDDERIRFKYWIRINDYCMVVQKIDENNTNISFEEFIRGERVEVLLEHRNENVRKVCLDIIRDYLERIGNRLREFVIETMNSPIRSLLLSNLTLRNCTKLKELRIGNTMRQIDLFEIGFIDFETIKNISSAIEIPSTSINFNQLIQLRARNIDIYYMETLNEKDVQNYIELWMDGKLHSNFWMFSINTAYKKSLMTRKIDIDLSRFYFRENTRYTSRKRIQSRVDPKSFLEIGEQTDIHLYLVVKNEK
ncbi:unnamed protein product [Caenorhabditis angaria]|uniref:F-box associated domain-containing protein n=1 Tax=Caenorhabditis angaria TaxID=860376 RepID=A0A9P1MUL6_9PELO|nr:unnamed protein product [Caenorhabditis angaria]